MSTLRVNDVVEVQPSDDLDPLSLEWKGRRCVVTSVKQGTSGSHHIRVEDLESRRRGTFREDDLVRR